MALELEKGKELAVSKLRVTAYKNHLSKDGISSYGKVQAPTNRITASNLIASLSTRNLGIDPELILYVAKLLHEETIRQLQEGRSVEVLGLGTAFISTKGSMKGLNPNLEDVPKMVLKFRPAKGITKSLKLVKVGSVEEAKILPEISTIEDKTTGAINGEIKKGAIVLIKGKRLRIEGNDINSAKIGVYFVKDNGDRKKIPIENIIINNPSSLMCILPKEVTPGAYYNIEVITQKKYEENKYAKTIKTGVSKFTVKVID